MLERPHIEFVQSQVLPWRRIGSGLARPGAEYKMLSRDPKTGGCTALMRYPAGWSREGPEHIIADEEIFVLDGSLRINDRPYSANDYAYLPSGYTRNSMDSMEGCVLLSFFTAEPDLIDGSGDGEAENSAHLISHLDTGAMPWDMTLNDPKLRHLGISRKDLRTDPETGERTFLSLILPQSAPENGKGAQESHPVIEEAYMISGSLTGPPGTMYPGGYFWRPPEIPHGPYGSRWGAVSLIRFVGGRHINVWSEDEAEFRFDTPYDPVLPDELAYARVIDWHPPAAY